MIKILAVCGNGMGTSMVIKMKVQKILKKLEIAAQVDYSSLEQAAAQIDNYNIILASAHVADEFESKDTKIISLVNIIDEKELEDKLVGALK
jgi:PTS system ascorbate-specific IIB component